MSKNKTTNKKYRIVIFIFATFIVAIGIFCALYPLVSNYLYERKQDIIITEYDTLVQEDDDTAIADALALAREYNKNLSANNVVLTDPFDPNIITQTSDQYDSLLNVSGNGYMGYIEIPVINVKLPIYHGCSEEVLYEGVGHLMGTSLPIGGESTHAALSGHTGLSGKKLFTDLVSLEEGDLFYIHIYGETLTYQVDQIKVVLPDETDDLLIVPGKDLITLITCTPYGINDHRLLVRGTRVETQEEIAVLEESTREAVDSNADSLWRTEYMKSIAIGTCCLLGTLCFLIVATCLIEKKKS